MNKVRFGTCNFISISAANSYYGKQGAKEAIKEGRIEIGKPKYNPKKHTLKLDTKEGRYWLEEI